MFVHSLLTAGLAVLTASLTCEAAVLDKRGPLLPSQDPFYTPPAGYASQAPGTVLKTRTITPSTLANIKKAYQLLYRTNSVNGSAIATVTTVFVPFGAKTDRIVHFQTAYDSSWNGCDPSYDYQFGSNGTDAITDFETTFIGNYLSAGYIVVSADYEGPDAAFTPGRLAGHCVLDSMRAVKNSQALLGLTTNNPLIAGVGYSGGAIATGWAASLQPTYAPELNIKGWAAGGVPANLTGVLVFIDDTAFSGFLPASVVGLMAPSAYGAQLDQYVNSIATPAGLAALAYASTHCAVDDLTNFAYKSILSTTFQTLGYNLLYQPTIQQVLQDNTMGLIASQTPTAPILVYHNEQDEIIPFSNTSTLVNNWCQYGASVNFTIFANGGHADGEVSGFPYQMSFVQQAFAGQLTKSGCTKTVVNNAVSLPFKRAFDAQQADKIVLARGDRGVLEVDVNEARLARDAVL